MKRRTIRKGPNGLKHGGTVGMMLSQIPAATLITLAYRLPMLWQAFANPNAAEAPELQRMVTEKLEAADHSARAVRRGSAATTSLLQQHAARQIRAAGRVQRALAARDPAAALQRLWQQGFLTAELLADLTARVGELGALTVRNALGPVHRRVTANAKRLSARAPKRDQS
jgi:hypothetical protein